MATTLAVKQPVWQRAISITIGTAIGGIIYGIFLQSLLIQSLMIDRKPLDPANWKTGLSLNAWIGGSFFFFTLVFVPLRFISKSAFAAINIPDEAGVLWFLITIIFLIQIATVIYAYMRPELNAVEHSKDVFNYYICRRKKYSLALSFDLTNWKNWVQVIIILMEFVQLFSMAINDGNALQNAGVKLFNPSMFAVIAQLRTAFWQFGMDTSSSSSNTYSVGFGLLCAFCGVYIFLCGVFIALDLTVDSPFSPILFTLLAGGFYGFVTSGLLTLIFYSNASSHIILGALMLVYYSSTAVFVSIYRSDLKKTLPGEIRIVPTFTAVERVLKGILSAITVTTITESYTIKSSISFVFCFVFAILIWYKNPYSVQSMNLLRLGSITLCCATSLLVLIASTFTSSSGIVLSVFLVGSWITIPCVFIAMNYCQRRQITPKIVSYATNVVVEIENPIQVSAHTVQPLQLKL